LMKFIFSRMIKLSRGFLMQASYGLILTIVIDNEFNYFVAINYYKHRFNAVIKSMKIAFVSSQPGPLRLNFWG